MSGKLPVVKAFGVAALGSLITSVIWCQNSPAQHGPVPIYQVTVIERSVRAVNYQYRSGPTKVDFRGTILLPHAKGEATVESKAGRIQEPRAEDVLLVKSDQLAPRHDIRKQLPKGIRLDDL